MLVWRVAWRSSSGYFIYGLFHLPQIDNREPRDAFTDWHGLAANIVLGLAGFHAAAALVHRYIWCDGLLKCMLRNSRRPCYCQSDAGKAH